VHGWPQMPAVHRHGIACGVKTVLELAGRKSLAVDHGPTATGVRYRVRWSG